MALWAIAGSKTSLMWPTCFKTLGCPMRTCISSLFWETVRSGYTGPTCPQSNKGLQLRELPPLDRPFSHSPHHSLLPGQLHSLTDLVSVGFGPWLKVTPGPSEVVSFQYLSPALFPLALVASSLLLNQGVHQTSTVSSPTDPSGLGEKVCDLGGRGIDKGSGCLRPAFHRSSQQPLSLWGLVIL